MDRERLVMLWLKEINKTKKILSARVSFTNEVVFIPIPPFYKRLESLSRFAIPLTKIKRIELINELNNPTAAAKLYCASKSPC